MTAVGPDRQAVLRAGDLAVVVDGGAGPRISSLRHRGTELLAVLDPPEVVGPAGGPQLSLHGGYRLWVAPESPEVTYRLDDRPCPVAADEGRAVVADAGTPLARRLEVVLDDTGLTTSHTLRNTGDHPLDVAPWAITQVRPGGQVVLPIGRTPVDAHGMQASGLVTTWPYTDLSDERIAFRPGLVTLEGRARDHATGPDATKVGVDGFAGWMAVLLDGTVLVVRTAPRPALGSFADLGATSQAYVHRRFTEVESLGPLTTLAPGGSRTLEQRWTIADAPATDPDVDAVAAIAQAAPAPAPRV